MIRQYELVERVKAYDPQADEALLNKAYVFAMKAHGSQKRASGDPYFSHPLEVAGILTDLKLDPATIATALLHDVVEDTSVSLEDVRQHFGDTIAELVGGVTKLSQLELNSEKTKQAENLRKLVLAMSKDIRVLLVKLADRLHNMRTLGHVDSAEKRRRIAAETLEIYAPLSGRIGMQDLREELEDLAFKELDPKPRESIQQRLKFLRETSGDVVMRITRDITQELAQNGVKAEVSGRQKSAHSMWRKMQSKEISFENLSDTFGFRVVVGSIDECYRALGIVHQAWQIVPGRFKDYISIPKPNGYRSIHTTVIGPEKHKIEMQIRTREMHDTAERGVAAHWRYKAGLNGKSHEIETAEYRWLQDLVAMLKAEGPAEEFLEHTKLQLFQDQVFCFTPKGELIVLPKGATPVDLAYAVHTEVGDTCVGARVNGRQVPLHTQLANGDSVEISRSKGQFPSPAWETFVVTGRAKTAIRRFVRQRARDDHIRLGRDVLEREFQRGKGEFSAKALQEGLKRLNQASVEDLLANVGQSNLSAAEVFAAIYPALAKKVPKPKRGAKPRSGSDPIPIQGLVPGLAVHMAECCHPLPGDRIVGITAPGKGIEVHTIDCAQLEAYHEQSEIVWHDLAWESEAEDRITSVARIRAVLRNEPGALGGLANTISDHDGNITNLKISERSHDFFEFVVDIEVRDAKHLNHILAALRASPLVSGVKRFGVEVR
jgi:GTP pyrophosphokinase